MEFSTSAKILGRTAVSCTLRVMRAKTEEGFLEGSVGRDPGVGFSGRKAAYSIALKVTKSEFVRNGVMII